MLTDTNKKVVLGRSRRGGESVDSWCMRVVSFVAA